MLSYWTLNLWYEYTAYIECIDLLLSIIVLLALHLSINELVRLYYSYSAYRYPRDSLIMM